MRSCGSPTSTGTGSPHSPPTPSAGSSPTSNCATAAGARCKDRIRCAKDTGLTNLPLHDFAQNQLWCAVIAIACELTAWMQLLALHGHDARRWEPKRLRLRLLCAAGRLTVSGCRVVLHLARAGRWTALLLHAITRLRAVPGPSG